MVVLAPMAAARLTTLQGRWAKLVLVGREYYVHNDLTRGQTRTIRSDLGWEPLWNVASTHAVVLYPRMRNQPKHLPHAQWATPQIAPCGTWIAYVRSMQNSLRLPDLDLQTEEAKQ